jgi:anti-sigma B factor antagonist
MKFSIEREDKLAIFHLDETRLDSNNSPDVKRELLILASDDIDVVIIDLSAVTFCDSSGLSSMLLAERQMREHDGGVIVVDANGKIRTLIEIAKLDSIIPVFATIEEARNALVD